MEVIAGDVQRRPTGACDRRSVLSLREARRTAGNVGLRATCAQRRTYGRTPAVPQPERPITFATADLMDAVVDAIAAARMPPRHDHLNKLLDDDVMEAVVAAAIG